MASRKSRPEPALLPPIDFHPPSNGEFWPRAPSRRAMEATQRWLIMVENKHRRLGMSRRQFANSACGYAAALLAINQAGCSAKKGGTNGASMGAVNPSPTMSLPGCGLPSCTTDGGIWMPDGGAPVTRGDAGPGPAGTSGVTPSVGSQPGSSPTVAPSSSVTPSGGSTSSARDSGLMGSDDAGFMVTEQMTEDMDAAMEMMAGNEFIIDVQTHTATEIDEPWDDIPPDRRALDFITQIFVQSETDVAVLSGPPNARALGAPNIAARDQVKELIDRLAGPRLLIHANAEPERGASEADYMGELAELYNPAAWKVYPHDGNLLLDSDELGAPFVEAARALGILMVAGHRGLWDNGGYTSNGSPRDMIRAAAAAPDIDFLIYHSGYERDNNEAHAYDPTAAEHYGVDRMIRGLEETGLGPGSNVYAELGSTWVNIMTEPEQAAHVLGKLLKTLGPERILWGTDCVYNGVPQSQIAAFRMFQIPEQMQQEFGYPALTQEVKEKIFGLNAARLYGVDVDATRTDITADDITALRTAMLDDPQSVPVPDRRLYEGPRTRREFMQLMKRDSFFGHG